MHELSKILADYKSLKATIGDLSKKAAELEDEIKNYMGETEELSVDGATVRWKKIQQSRFDTTEFRKKHAALYEQFLKQNTIRRFTVT